MENNILDLILNNIGQGVIALNSDRAIVSCNRRAADDLGFVRADNANITEVIADKVLLGSIEEAITKNTFITFDITREDGEVFELRLLPVTSNDICLIIVSKNVTAIRKIALEKQEFFANAGHELNTPLSSIIGYSEMLTTAKSATAAEQKKNKEFAAVINKEATRMKHLIDDMLKVSELEENKELVDEVIDFEELLEGVIKSAVPKIKAKKITFLQESDQCFIVANRAKIIEVAANLIDNAIKYTHEGGQITIRLRNKEGKVSLKVTDNGKGIPEKSLSRVFERFYRVDKGRNKDQDEGGTGLGLAIVKHICAHYNAPIKLQSKVGMGTRISIAFDSFDG
ncbi:MAG: ATP-binding protein [Firmicutes bacterium]|nr:ATP-binding protein [Bacillota bacterium]